MSLRRFVPHIAARSTLTTFGPSTSALTGSSNPLPGQSLGGWCGELSLVSAIHTTSGCFPSEDGEFPPHPCSRETANAFACDAAGKASRRKNIFATTESTMTAKQTPPSTSSFVRRNKNADTPHATTAEPIGQARQPAPNFWFEMATERKSGIDLGLKSSGIAVGNDDEETKKVTSGPRSVSTYCDPHNDYAAQHHTMQDFHRSCRFIDSHSHSKKAEESGNTNAPFGNFTPSSPSPNASTTSSSSSASNAADTHTSSKRLVHTSVQRLTTLDHMRKVLPLSRTPQTSVDYFLM